MGFRNMQEKLENYLIPDRKAFPTHDSVFSHCCKNNKRQTLGDSLNKIDVHLSHKEDIKLDLDLFPLLPLVNGRYSKVSWVVVGLG